MAITTTILDRGYIGVRRVVYGKSVLSGTVTTGEVVTGLRRVIFFSGVPVDSAQKGFAVNEDFPCTNDITVHVETADSTFYWMAIGDPV